MNHLSSLSIEALDAVIGYYNALRALGLSRAHALAIANVRARALS